MTERAIVLTTFNARYTHASFGLRCLRAALGPLKDRCTLVEATLGTRPLTVVERILAHGPRVVGVGVYVWNARESLHLVQLLKAVAPDVIVVIGGPEVSHELDEQPIAALADHVVRGEGEVAFRRVCEHVLRRSPLALALPRWIDGGNPNLADLPLPYDEYSDRDLAERTIYVEASRGCPFRCAFCLSALDRGVRAYPRPAFLAALDRLHARGLRRFKFVDRTFNLALADAIAIVEFFLAKDPTDLFVHFEMIPDRLPPELLALLARFPPGAVQLELGFQTFDPDVAKTIARRTDRARAVANVQALRQHTGAHIHADLIAGLPGETWSSFSHGFDALLEAGPQEIQLGILKRLRGAPLTRLPGIEALAFDPSPPYEVLQTPTMSFGELARIRRIARLWDVVFNHGKAPRVCAVALEAWRGAGSVFEGLAAWTDEVVQAEPAWATVGLARLLEHLHRHLCERVDDQQVAEAIKADYRAGGVRGQPTFLFQDRTRGRSSPRSAGPPRRQQRHASHE